jgi:RNA polymerase sigma-70 factor (ECF subfamily)
LQSSNNKNDWFDSFVEDTRGPLAAYIRKIVSSPDDVQGVMQDAYLKVFLALRKFRSEGHSPTALLYTTAHNLAISRLRHQKVIQHSVTAVSIAEELRGERLSAEQSVSDSQKHNELMLIINALPPKCRDVFVLRWIHGMSQRAISERLNIAVSTVEKHLAKGLRFCKDKMLEKAATAEADTVAAHRKRSVGEAS